MRKILIDGVELEYPSSIKTKHGVFVYINSLKLVDYEHCAPIIEANIRFGSRDKIIRKHLYWSTKAGLLDLLEDAIREQLP